MRSSSRASIPLAKLRDLDHTSVRYCDRFLLCLLRHIRFISKRAGGFLAWRTRDPDDVRFPVVAIIGALLLPVLCPIVILEVSRKLR